jgi:4-hydroxy-tetrahydrodipicolinate synthase
MSEPLFRGVMPALVTPFRNGEVDEQGYRELIEWQIAEGSNGIVPVGTTGESPTLDHEEHERVIAAVCERAAGRIPVVAGTGSNSTAEAIRMTRAAKKAGADGTLQVGPYYNKPTQEGYYRHFGAIAEACELPQVIYNIPGRTGSEIAAETIARLAERYPTNWELSAARATTVVRFFIRDGVGPGRLAAAGYGAMHPITTNASAEGRSRNRRVEIVLTRLK